MNAPCLRTSLVCPLGLRHPPWAASPLDWQMQGFISQGYLGSTRIFARDLTLGARWEIARNLLLVGEYHFVDGTAWLAEKDNPRLRAGEEDRFWHVFALMVSLRF